MPQQLDIFADSRGTVLRNDVIAALRARDAAAVAAAFETFAATCPDDPLRSALARLAAALPAPAPFADHAAAAAALSPVEQEVVPAATAVFGSSAGQWLQPLWRQFAAAAAALDFARDAESTDAAAFALRAGDWSRAIARVEAIEFWRRKPVALAWMAEALCRGRSDGFDAAWPLLIELAWLSPRRFGELAARLEATPVAALLDRYEAEFDAEPASPDWFPAWALITEPSLAAGLRQTLRQTDGGPEAAARLVAELLGLERRGRQRELLAARKALLELHPGLFRCYMQSR